MYVCLQPRTPSTKTKLLCRSVRSERSSKQLNCRGTGSGGGGARSGAANVSGLNPSLIDLIFLMSRCDYRIQTTGRQPLRDMCSLRDQLTTLAVAEPAQLMATTKDGRGRGGEDARRRSERQYLHRLSPVFVSSSCPFAY